VTRGHGELSADAKPAGQHRALATPGTIRLIVFDLDGTLVDSRRDLAESANEVLVFYGGTPHSEETIARMVGEGAATLVSRVFAAAGLSQPPEALARFLSIYNSRPLRHTRAYPGVRDALADLAGRVALAVLTNKPRESTETILDGLDLSVYFGRRIVAGDDPFPRKPDPAGLAHLIDQAEVTRHDTLLVGDSIVDWRTAQAAGTRACIVRYGLGFADFPVDELEEQPFIDTLAEIRNML
jgi:phosphoglycolate phosphatase